ncbi:MAG: ABC transporter permease [Cyanobacteria bacterium NC_groundwater_1444_Ag_S-0.65um_54_12]|nr:ABC transporter permease [Cyanobacteria bacterium NC_groundwater_1444_Ag_S-0.65um_54_12]
MSFFSALGQCLLNWFEALGNYSILSFQALRLLTCGHLHWRNTFRQMVFIGIGSLPIALLTALSVGMVFTLQIANEFINYGATSVIGGVAAMAIVRELGPTLTGVVFAGRVSAAIAAELGTMKVTEQIDALISLATDPVRYLVLPRVLACLTMLPLLTFFSDVLGIAGGYLVATALKGISPLLFTESVRSLIGPADILKGLGKAALFGWIVAIVGCQKGMSARGGAQGVGAATTQSVVIALLAIFISNYFLSSWLFPGGESH